MTTGAKIGLWAAIIGLAWLGYNYAKSAVSAFTYSIARYGSPSVSGGLLTLPIAVRFVNPTPVTVNLDNVHADLFVQKMGQWVKAGVVDQALSVPPGTSDQSIIPRIDLSAIIGTNIASFLTLVSSAVASRSVQVRADVTVTYGGVPLPTKSFTNLVPIA